MNFSFKNDSKAAFTLAEVNSLAPLRERVRERGLKHAAFTKPSRATSEARDEHASTYAMSIRCKCERWRLMRGAVSTLQSKAAFTLAEVLIVLGVVGVVAALTLPTLISNINDKVTERQINVMNRKITQGTEGMQMRGALLNTYSTTGEFLQELSKDMKILSICDKDHLRDCWPYDDINVTIDGESVPIDITTQTDGKSTFQMKKGCYGDVMGVIFGNGTPMLLTYDLDTPILDPDSTYEVDKATGKGPTSKGIIGVYDRNGAKGPNKYGVDVVSFNANGYGPKKNCWSKAGGVCFFGDPFVADEQQALAVGNEGACNTILSTNKYTDTNNLFGAGEGAEISVTIEGDYGTSCGYGVDRWLAAAVQCGAKGMRLPSESELEALATELYPGGTWSGDIINGTLTTNLPTSLSGLGSSWYILWSSSAINTDFAWNRYFTSLGSGRLDFYRKDSDVRAVCVAD